MEKGWQSSTLVNFLGRMLSSTIFSSMWFAMKTDVLLVLLLKLVPKPWSPKMAILVHHFILFIHVLCARHWSRLITIWGSSLRSCHVVKMVKKSSRVSHTSSRMVRTCCWHSPSAGLHLPPQLTSNCINCCFAVWPPPGPFYSPGAWEWLLSGKDNPTSYFVDDWRPQCRPTTGSAAEEETTMMMTSTGSIDKSGQGPKRAIAIAVVLGWRPGLKGDGHSWQGDGRSSRVTAVALWAKAPGTYCCVAVSIPAVTPRYCTQNIENALRCTRKNKEKK
jgi:hypothetical protein